MTDQTDRPEVDDPRVLALAKARQQLAYENPFNAVCPPWDGLSEQEQRLSLLGARSYLHAALNAGLVPPAGRAPATDRAELSARLWQIAEQHIVAEWICCEPLDPKHQLCAKGYAALEMAKSLLVDADPARAWNPAAPLLDAVLDEIRAAALLPAPADRAAVLREAADRYEAMLADANTAADPRYWTAIRDMAHGLRYMANETPFIPAAHYRRDDGVDCCVHTIPVGSNSCPACREFADDAPAAGPTVLDEVVAALTAKAQALSVEAEEEMRRDLEDQAQVWHEAAELARHTGRKAERRSNPQPAAGAQQTGEA